MKPSPIESARVRLEAKIEELIALLDLLDGDENLEPYLSDAHPGHEDREAESDFELSKGWSNPEGLRVHIPRERKQLQAMGYDCGLWRAS